MIILDTSGLLAAIDASQAWHDRARRALEATPPPWLLSPFVLAELDYLLAARVGEAAEPVLRWRALSNPYQGARHDSARRSQAVRAALGSQRCD